MQITVQKFGGTSVGNSNAINQVFGRVNESTSDIVIVVSSAMSKVTDLLIVCANLAINDIANSLFILDEIKNIHHTTMIELKINSEDAKQGLDDYLSEIENILIGINYISEITNKIMDKIQSYGELLSTFILYHYFIKFDKKCILLDSRDFIKTDSKFGGAKVDFEQTKENFSKLELQTDYIYILQGFIASDSIGNTTTLGRGGSDYSAAVIGSALKQNGKNVKEIEIWTDVNGIMTSDPREDSQAKTINEISFDEVLKLSYYGAKVIHPDTVKPAIENDIPVIVRNTFQPENLGTKILKTANNKQNVTINLKSSILIDLKDFNQKKLLDKTNKILNILLYAGSIIYYQNLSVYQSRIIFKKNNINLEDYLSDIDYKIVPIELFAYIGNNTIAYTQYKDYLMGVDNSIILKINSFSTKF